MDQLKDKVDVIFFDGGSNFQLAGRIIQAKFPQITVVHGLEHVLSLVFEDIAAIPVIKVQYILFVAQCTILIDISYSLHLSSSLQQLILQVKRLYRTFGSGSNHKPFAYFNQQSKTYNKGRSIGLLRA